MNLFVHICRFYACFPIFFERVVFGKYFAPSSSGTPFEGKKGFLKMKDAVNPGRLLSVTKVAGLVADLSQKSGAAFEPASFQPIAMAESHTNCLFKYAVARVRNELVAEDLVQDTFVAALKGRAPFAGRSSELTWLTGILRHKIYDHLRRQFREQSFHVVPPDLNRHPGDDEWYAVTLDHVPSDIKSPLRRMELLELREDLQAAIRKLNPRIAKVFQLYEIENRSHNEICEHLEISSANLWVMLHRARKQLRSHLVHWVEKGQLSMPACRRADVKWPFRKPGRKTTY